MATTREIYDVTNYSTEWTIRELRKELKNNHNADFIFRTLCDMALEDIEEDVTETFNSFEEAEEYLKKNPTTLEVDFFTNHNIRYVKINLNNCIHSFVADDYDDFIEFVEDTDFKYDLVGEKNRESVYKKIMEEVFFIYDDEEE